MTALLRSRDHSPNEQLTQESTLKVCRSIGVAFICLLAAACSREVAHTPLNVEEYQATTLTDIYPNRFWGDEAPEELEEKIRAGASILERRFPEAATAELATAPTSRLLAISGGGADGAFGAGLLAGWSESGTRVEFDVVTGVSTGAMIAPFAFLGAGYDDTLVDIYATANSDKVFELALFGGLILGSAATDTAPLKRQIEEHVTLDLINKLADEQERARNLFIVTTHFDARRPVVWDLVAIAQGRDAQAVDLIRQIILASAAIPALFPPVPIEFEVNGKRFTELHVDGGLSNNIFAYSAQIPVGRLNELLGLTFRREVYVLQNSNERLPYDPAPTGVVPIAQRAVSTLLQNQLNADVERIFRLSRRDGLEFRMVAIPEEFEANDATGFDPVYMNALVELGRALGRTGDFWKDRPNSVGAEE